MNYQKAIEISRRYTEQILPLIEQYNKEMSEAYGDSYVPEPLDVLSPQFTVMEISDGFEDWFWSGTRHYYRHGIPEYNMYICETRNEHKKE